MAQRIFISYRRDDSRGYAGRLQGDLSRRYSDEHVFRDIEIPPGADFGEYITGLVDKCNVVLAIIGPGWLDARNREGERRIDNPEDWVRLEIERALARDGVEVIPVLVDGARLPPREELPESLLALRRRNAFELSDRRWDYDVEPARQAPRRAAAGHERAPRPPRRRSGADADADTAETRTAAGAGAGRPHDLRRPRGGRRRAAHRLPRRPPRPQPGRPRAAGPRRPRHRPRLRAREGDLLRHRRGARGARGGLPLAPLARADRLLPARPGRGDRRPAPSTPAPTRA